MDTLPSGLPIHVEDEEDLARFLTSSSQFNTHGPKTAAFLPNPADGKKSVFRHGLEPRTALWLLAGQLTVHGVAIVKARHVREAGLDVISEEPPPRHANIVGYVLLGDDPRVAKADYVQQANLVAQRAKMTRR